MRTPRINRIVEELRRLQSAGYESSGDDDQKIDSLEEELAELCIAADFTEEKPGRFIIREGGKIKHSVIFPRIARQMARRPRFKSRKVREEMGEILPEEVTPIDGRLEFARQIITEGWEELSDEFYRLKGQVRTGELAASNDGYLRRWWKLQRVRIHSGLPWKRYQLTYAWTGKGHHSYTGPPPAEVTLDNIDLDTWERNWQRQENLRRQQELRRIERENKRLGRWP